MKKLPVLLQIYSVREDAERDLKGTLCKVREMGYDGVELAGLYGLTVQEVKEALAQAGLPAVSAHVPYQELTADLEKTVEDYVDIGCKYIAVPYLTEELRPGTARFGEVVEEIKRIGECCNRHGVVLLYHNHDFEFVKMPDGRYGLDYLYEEVPASLLQTELDTCWVKVAGENPAAYVKKYAGRCPVVHLKDFYREGNPQEMYELIGIETKEKREQTGRFEFRPLGLGMQVMPEILQAAEESGAEYLVVEQDSSVGRSAMEAVSISRRYLQLLGL